MCQRVLPPRPKDVPAVPARSTPHSAAAYRSTPRRSPEGSAPTNRMASHHGKSDRAASRGRPRPLARGVHRARGRPARTRRDRPLPHSGIDAGIYELKGISGRGSCTALLRPSKRDSRSSPPRDRLSWGLRLSTRARPRTWPGTARTRQSPKEPAFRRQRTDNRDSRDRPSAAGPVAGGLAVVGPVSRDRPGDCSPDRFDSGSQPLRARFRIYVRFLFAQGVCPPTRGPRFELVHHLTRCRQSVGGPRLDPRIPGRVRQIRWGMDAGRGRVRSVNLQVRAGQWTGSRCAGAGGAMVEPRG